MINGLTTDEQAYFLPESSTKVPLSEAGYAAWANSVGGGDTAAILRRYPTASFGSPSLAEIAAAQDSKTCIALMLDRMLSKHVPVFAYEFADDDAPSYYPARSYPLKAFHTAELQYLFRGFHGARGEFHTLNAEQDRLAESMVQLWTSFAVDGTPISGDMEKWAVFDPARNNVLVLRSERSTTVDSAFEKCEFWDPINARH
jgi:para-nitrobenzyl esterase